MVCQDGYIVSSGHKLPLVHYICGSLLYHLLIVDAVLQPSARRSSIDEIPILCVPGFSMLGAATIEGLATPRRHAKRVPKLRERYQLGHVRRV